MQCVNCGFENIPGMQRCVRCQSSLELATVEIAPPRAGRLGWGTGWRRLWYSIGPALWRLGQYRIEWRRLFIPRNPAPWDAVVLSALLPGLGHIRYRNRIIGVLLLLVWLGCLVPGVLMYGSNQGSWLINWAIFTHAIAILSLLTTVQADFRERCLNGLMAFAVVGMLGYLPAAWLASRLWTGIALYGLQDNPKLYNGETVLVEGPWRRSTTFRRGDIVLYQIHHMGEIHGGGAYVNEGFGLDRIIGLPGDQVTIKDGQLFLNGQLVPEDLRPLGVLPRVGTMQTQAGPDQYVIIPTAIPLAWRGDRVDAAGFVAFVSRVPATDIEGRLEFRTHPWSRWGPIH